MTFNKLNNLIEKYNLTNIIKVCIILIVLYLVANVFIPDSIIDNMMPVIIENFGNLGNSTMYGNELSLIEQTNTPSYVSNTCVFRLAGTYRIDSLKFIFNANDNANTGSGAVSKYTIPIAPATRTPIFIQYLDGSGNMKNIKSTLTDNGSPPNFAENVISSDMSLSLDSITDENSAPVYTSQIVLTIGTSVNNISIYKDTKGNGYISKFGIYGGDRNLITPTDYNTLSTNLNLTSTSFVSPTTPLPSLAPVQTPTTINKYTFNNSNNNINDMMIYSMKLTISTITNNSTNTQPNTTLFKTTDAPFTVKITYANTIYSNKTFPIIKTYIVRSDGNRLESTNSFIFLIDPIIANSITFSIVNVNNVNYSGTTSLNITGVDVLGKAPSALDISDYKKNVNSALNSIESEQNSNICPNINELVDKQTKTQQICDNLEFQDKTKSEKLRLERNKQYLLKLQNQQEQIDQLNNVINNLETQRENRATTSDKVRVLQYQKQAEDASTVRDLANQRLNSQDNNQLYLDVKVNNII